MDASVLYDRIHRRVPPCKEAYICVIILSMASIHTHKRNLIESFRAAGNGFWFVLRHETTFKYMVAIGILVLAGMLYFKTSRAENVALLTMIFTVLGLELINTALERFLDFIDLKEQHKIKVIKDLMAAIVLLASIGAAVIGLIIFLPHIQK